jgi:hypothetical protein
VIWKEVHDQQNSIFKITGQVNDLAEIADGKTKKDAKNKCAYQIL